MTVQIEDAGIPCPNCAQPLSYLTLVRTVENSDQITITSCPKCGIVHFTPEQIRQYDLANDKCVK